MSPQLQTIIALAVTAAAAAWLIWRAVAKSAKPGCGSGCGCPATEIKTKLRAKP